MKPQKSGEIAETANGVSTPTQGVGYNAGVRKKIATQNHSPNHAVTRTSLWGGVATALLFLSTRGCPAETPSAACPGCAVDWLCVEGQCVKPCNTYSDCPQQDQACTDGYCQEVADAECDKDAACPVPSSCQVVEGNVCRAGRCVYGKKAEGDFCDDDDKCTIDDRCNRDGVCAGTPRLCLSPPAISCTNGNTTLRSYASPGACDPDSPLVDPCVYTPLDVGCANCLETCMGKCLGSHVLFYFPLNEGAGVNWIVDNSTPRNDGRCAAPGCPTLEVPGKNLTAAEFDGTDDRFVLDNSTGLCPTNYSLSAWVNPAADTTGYIVTKPSTSFTDVSYSLLVESGPLSARCSYKQSGTTYATNPVAIDTGVWSHLTCVYRANPPSLKIYVNGAKADEQEFATAAPVSTDGPVVLGAFGDQAVEVFDGVVDDPQLCTAPFDDSGVCFLAGRVWDLTESTCVDP